MSVPVANSLHSVPATKSREDLHVLIIEHAGHTNRNARQGARMTG